MRPGDFPAPSDGGSRGVNRAAREPLQPPAARRRRSGAHAAPFAGASSADGGAGAPQSRQLPRRRVGLPAVATGGSVGGGRRGACWGGVAVVGGRGGVAPPGWPDGGGAGPGPWAPQDARTERAPGTSNDKPPARPSPRRTRSGRGAAGTRKTRPGAAARDRPPQPAQAHRRPVRKPGMDFPPLRPALVPMEKPGEGRSCAGSRLWNGKWGRGDRLEEDPERILQVVE